MIFVRISKRLIRKVADNLSKRGTFTQEDVQAKIEEILGRALDSNEKRRITLILRNEYVLEKVERDAQNGGQRIFYFL